MGTINLYNGNLAKDMRLGVMPPTVVCWNRLEARPRKDDFTRSLKAEIRDPLWMLTRQWQLGEFLGNDAGSPVFAKVQVASSKLNIFKSRLGDPEPLDTHLPLEPHVEAATVKMTIQLRLQLGRIWNSMLRKLHTAGTLSKNYIPDYQKAYSFSLPVDPKTPGDAEAHADLLGAAQIYSNEENLQLLSAVSGGRGFDGGKFLKDLQTAGNPFTEVSPASGDEAPLIQAGKDFLDWYTQQYKQPASPADDNWAPQQLEYQFSCSAPHGSNEQLVLLADQYDQGSLDWYAFDVHHKVNALHPKPGQLVEDTLKKETYSFIPVPIRYGGMPHRRWWRFEAGRTNFAATNVNTTDLASLLLMDFAVQTSNDWFLIPYELETGSLFELKGLAVTDVFGQRTWVEAAGKGANSDWNRWSMYTLQHRDAQTAADTFVFIPPVAMKPMQGEPIEKVCLMKDEMANLVWGIEQAVQLENSKGKSGYEAATQVYNYLERIFKPADEPVTENPDKPPIRWELQNSTAENWIPFIPVHLAASDRDIRLRRARLLRNISGMELPLSVSTVKARTSLINYGLDTNQPYDLFEEEVPRAGKYVKLNWQRCRGEKGEIYTWIGRQANTGKGEGNSNLEFDALRDQK